jgi:hypothetical protein
MHFIHRNLASQDKQEITPIVKNTLLSVLLIIKFNTKYIPENHAYCSVITKCSLSLLLISRG